MRNGSRKLTAGLLAALLTFAHAVPAFARAAPVAASFSTAVAVSAQTVLQLQGSDGDGTALTYATTSGPAHGALSSLNTSTGAVVYTPAAGYTGADSFQYTVTSAGDTSAAGTVTITVTASKTRVIHTFTYPDSSPMKGKVSFFLTQVASSPSGTIPAKASVSCQLNSTGQCDVQLYPSRAVSPVQYYQAWFDDAVTRNTQLVGLYDIPASTTTISLDGHKVTDANLSAQYVFASKAEVDALTAAVAAATAAQLFPSLTAGRHVLWNGSGFANSAVSESGGTITVTGNEVVTGTVTAVGGYAGILAANVPNLPASRITTETLPDARIASAATWHAKQDALGFTPRSAAAPTVDTFHGRSGPVTLQSSDLNGLSGAGLSGIGTGTGGVLNAGTTTVGADTDADGVGALSLQTRGVERVAIENDGTVKIGGQTVSLPFNVKTYGAKGDGSTNDTAAVQAAITAAGAAGGVVFIPPASSCYKVTGLTVASNYVRLKGEGWASRICMANATGDTLTFDNGLSGDVDLTTFMYGSGVEDVRFEPLVTRTSGWEVKAVHFDVFYCNRNTVRGAFGAFLFGRTTDHAVIANFHHNRLEGYKFGLRLIQVLDGWFTSNSFDQARVADGARGVWLDGGNESCTFTGNDVVNREYVASLAAGATWYSLYVKNTSGTATVSRFNKFTGNYWDSGSTGAWVEDGMDNRWSNDYFEGWSDSGIVITGTVSNSSWDSCDFVNSGTVGAYVDTTGTGNQISDSLAAGNNRRGLGAAGFQLATGVVNFRLSHNVTATSFPGSGTQLRSLQIDANVHHVTAEGNDFSGGVTIAAGVHHLTFTDNDCTAGLTITATATTNVFARNVTANGFGDAVLVQRSTSQSIPNAALTDVLHDTDLSDNNNMHDEVTVGGTAPLFGFAPGVYTVNATVTFASNATGFRQVSLVRSDGVEIATQRVAAISGSVSIVNVSGSALLTAGQSMKVQVYQDSGGGLNITGAAASMMKQ